MENKKGGRKGKAFIVTTKGKFIPSSDLQPMLDTGKNSHGEQVLSLEKDSSIKDKETERKFLDVKKGLVSPPYGETTFSSYLQYFDSSPVFSACVKRIAQDCITGWTLPLKEGAKENDAEKEKALAFLKKNNLRNHSIRYTLRAMLNDRGSVGNMALEIIRNQANEIEEIYQVPAYEFRIHKSRKTFAQVLNFEPVVWLKQFGLEEQYSRETGQELNKAVEPNKRANELIYISNYYPKSRYYGMPDVVHATGDVSGLIKVRDYNLAFFENYGIPAVVVLLEGEWDKETADIVTDYFQHIRGAESQHEPLVLQLPEQGGKVTFHKLSTEVKEGSFDKLDSSYTKKILMAHSMPPYRIGLAEMGALGGNVAEEQTKIYIESVVEPIQLDIEEMMNDAILPALGTENYKFILDNLDIRDIDKEYERRVKGLRVGAYNQDEIRAVNGDPPKEDGSGQTYYIDHNLAPIGEPPDSEMKMQDIFDEMEKFKSEVQENINEQLPQEIEKIISDRFEEYFKKLDAMGKMGKLIPDDVGEEA